MPLPMYPLLLEIHYKCNASHDGQWTAAEIAFSDNERRLIAKAADIGYLQVDPIYDFGDYLSISITDHGRKTFGLPRPNPSKAGTPLFDGIIAAAFGAVRRRLYEK